VEFVSIPSPLEAEQAFEDGRVDVLGGSEFAPPGSKLLAEGGVHFIPGINDYDVLKVTQIGGWAAREDYIAAHPDVVRRFIRGLTKAVRWANAHPEEAQTLLNTINGLPPQLFKYTKWRPASNTLLVDDDSIRKWTSILEEFGQIAPGSIDPDDVYTNAFNPYFKPARP
jgi:ABC-type nitrate/sulfonate/bicarbonate transport system substrate-binding protein